MEKTLWKRLSGVGLPSPIVVAAILIGCLFLLRLPTAFFPHELDVGESQMLAQGMKFLVDPVPWRAVDGSTSGPLNSYLFSVLLLAGFKASYALAHLLATGLVCLHVWIAYRTLL